MNCWKIFILEEPAPNSWFVLFSDSANLELYTDTADLLMNGVAHKLVALVKSFTRWNKIMIDTNSSDIYPT